MKQVLAIVVLCLLLLPAFAQRKELTQAQRDSLVSLNFRLARAKEERQADSIDWSRRRMAKATDSLRRVAELAEAAKAPYRSMYVNVPVLNVRSSPNANAALVVKLHAPALVTVYNPTSKNLGNKTEANDWVKVSYSIDSWGSESKMWAGWAKKSSLVPLRENVTAAISDSEASFLPGDPQWPNNMAVSGNNSIAVYGKGANKTVKINDVPITVVRKYQRGPRGGCFYYSSGGKKVYVDKSLCN